MSNLNFELIYKLRRYNIDSQGNYRARACNAATKKADEEYAKMRQAVSNELGHDNFLFSSYACVADGIGCHVHVPADGSDTPVETIPKELGKLRCVLCGLDDFDF